MATSIPLNDYVAKKAPAGWDFADFPKGELNYVGYFDPAGGRFGGKTLYLIPGLHGGSVIMFYRKDLFKAAGVGMPEDVGRSTSPPRRS